MPERTTQCVAMILWALGPKDPGQGMLLAFAALVLTLAGVSALVRLRTWGWVAVGASAALALAGGHLFGPAAGRLAVAPSPTLAGVLLLAAAIPFAGPAVRFLRRA